MLSSQIQRLGKWKEESSHQLQSLEEIWIFLQVFADEACGEVALGVTVRLPVVVVLFFHDLDPIAPLPSWDEVQPLL